MPGKRPINADTPPVDGRTKPAGKQATASGQASAPDAPAKPTVAPEPSAPSSRRPRGKVPGALKAIGGLVVVAIVFLVAAVLGGGNSHNRSSEPAPAPAAPSSAPEETPAAAAAEELGYPSFATNNTTRVGGSDAASTAAAIALAVYPSTTAAQRPAAVAIVDEDEWQAATAAAVLMSAPIHAPALVSSGGELPDATQQALEALAPQGSKATEGAQAFAIGSAPAVAGLKTSRVPKGSAAAVAVGLVALRDKLAGKPPAAFVLAPEDSPEFAMPAAAWSARSGDPILFTPRDKLPGATARALGEMRKAPVYVLGPSSAISSKVVREVAKIGNEVRRVSGETPVENAIALARYASGGFGWNVNDPGHGFVVARSDAALAGAIAAPLSASGTWGPLLLTDDAGTLPKALREYLLDVKPGYTTDPSRAFYNHVWIIGDQEAIDVKQQAQIDQLAELAKIRGEP